MLWGSGLKERGRIAMCKHACFLFVLLSGCPFWTLVAGNSPGLLIFECLSFRKADVAKVDRLPVAGWGLMCSRIR